MGEREGGDFWWEWREWRQEEGGGSVIADKVFTHVLPTLPVKSLPLFIYILTDFVYHLDLPSGSMAAAPVGN